MWPKAAVEEPWAPRAPPKPKAKASGCEWSGLAGYFHRAEQGRPLVAAVVWEPPLEARELPFAAAEAEADGEALRRPGLGWLEQDAAAA